MSTVKRTRMTAEEFFDFAHRPENRHKHFELHQGEVVEMPSPGERHGLVCVNVATTLNLYVRQRRCGYVLCNDSGIVLEKGPDTVLGPDVAYFDLLRRYGDLNPKWAEAIPTLAVEVWSPSDRPGKMTKRAARFLQAGARMVWVIDPEERDVTVYQKGQDDKVFDFAQEVIVEDVLPGFHCPVAEFFFMCGDAPATGPIEGTPP